jgi:hypothetical protein
MQFNCIQVRGIGWGVVGEIFSGGLDVFWRGHDQNEPKRSLQLKAQPSLAKGISNLENHYVYFA